MGGYVYAFNDGTSTSSVGMAALCACGHDGAPHPPTYSIYGGGVGINLNQMMATTATSPTAGPIAVTGTGIKYAVSSLPPGGGLRIQIHTPETDTASTSYCATAATASGTLAWAAFNTKCYDATPDGMALTAAPTDATKIEFEAPASAMATNWDFCVTTLAFAP